MTIASPPSSQNFPVIQEQAFGPKAGIQRLVADLRDNEEREDLKTLARGYLNLLDKENKKNNRFFPMSVSEREEQQALPNVGE